MKSKILLRYIQQFFKDYLITHRGVSSNTVIAYRDALKLFLKFICKHKNKKTFRLTLDDLTAGTALAFLKEIECTRKNSIVTRNLRLAALRTFFTYLATQDILRAGEYQKIIAIPLKRALTRNVEYLEEYEVSAIFNTIDRKTSSGERDYVLLNLLYNTGARVQEICDLCVESVNLGRLPLVTITGKGNKIRQTPIWPETAEMLYNYLKARKLLSNSRSNLFLNSRGNPLGRFGVRYIIHKRVAVAAKSCPSIAKKKISPHTFRHTTAMHLLQAGVDLTAIKMWLGHVNLSTTHSYVEINLDMKRKALSACSPSLKPSALKTLINKNKDVIDWLESL